MLRLDWSDIVDRNISWHNVRETWSLETIALSPTVQMSSVVFDEPTLQPLFELLEWIWRIE